MPHGVSPTGLGPVSEAAEDLGSLISHPVSVPTGEGLEDRGVRSTGDVWTDLVTRWWLQLAGRCEKDPDGDLSGAYGDLEALRTLQAQLEPLLADEAALIVALQGVPLDQPDP